ncbi:unnamed protein product, partial [Meganyctiphanes norvegica]
QMSDMMEGNQYNIYFDDFHKLWISNRKEFSKVLLDQLASCNNPYLHVLQSMKRYQGLKKPMPENEVSEFLKTFQIFKNQKNDPKKFQEYGDENILNSLLDIIPGIKNNGIQILFVKFFCTIYMNSKVKLRFEAIIMKSIVSKKDKDAYDLISTLKLQKVTDSEDRIRFESIIRNMIASQKYKAAFKLISSLKLHKLFERDDLLIPFFLKYNKVNMVENFIDDSPTHQKEFLTVLDNLVGNKRYFNHLMLKYNVRNKSILKAKPEYFSKIATRLLQKYDLDMSHCPYIFNRKMWGRLHFTFKRYYKEKSIQQSSFFSILLDDVKDNTEMQILMIKFFCKYHDMKAALHFTKMYQLPLERLPNNVKKEYIKYSPEELENIMILGDNGIEEVIENWDYTNPDYYSLQLAKNDVILVNTVDTFFSCMEKACKPTLVAVDAEWFSSFGLGETTKMCLLQLAFDNQAFLIDIIMLLPILDETHWLKLSNIFTNGNIRKIGFGIDGDIKVLKTINQTMIQNLVSVKNTLDLKDCWNQIMDQCPNDINKKGLSGMVFYCFGRPLNKREQISNWSARPLSVSKMKYAALDAQCLLDIYNYLEERCQALGLPDWKIKHLMVSRIGYYEDQISDMTEDNQFDTCFNELHELWISSRNEFDKVLMDQLQSCSNPCLLVLQCIKRCPGFNKLKKNNEVHEYLEMLHSFKQKTDDHTFQEYVDENILNALIEIIPNYKVYNLQILFAKAFGLVDTDIETRLRFEPVIKDFISQQQYKEACKLISVLKLHEHFESYKLLVPLYLKYNELIAVENFIDGSPKHQKEFLTVLDNFVGNIGHYEILVQEYKIENKIISETKTKSFRNLAMRLLKKYNLDISHCPHIQTKVRRSAGTKHPTP